MVQNPDCPKFERSKIQTFQNPDSPKYGQSQIWTNQIPDNPKSGRSKTQKVQNPDGPKYVRFKIQTNHNSEGHLSFGLDGPMVPDRSWTIQKMWDKMILILSTRASPSIYTHENLVLAFFFFFLPPSSTIQRIIRIILAYFAVCLSFTQCLWLS